MAQFFCICLNFASNRIVLYGHAAMACACRSTVHNYILDLSAIWGSVVKL